MTTHEFSDILLRHYPIRNFPAQKEAFLRFAAQQFSIQAPALLEHQHRLGFSCTKVVFGDPAQALLRKCFGTILANCSTACSAVWYLLVYYPSFTLVLVLFDTALSSPCFSFLLCFCKSQKCQLFLRPCSSSCFLPAIFRASVYCVIG